MTVVILESCPQGLRGDMTKWLLEINTGVYVGNINARVRDHLWERICANIRNGKETMVWSVRGEQGMNFRVHNTTLQPIDYDGITLMMRPLPSSETACAAGCLRAGFSKAAKARMIQRAGARRTAAERSEDHENCAESPASSSSASSNYVVIDIETTGLRSASDSILEIGAIKVCNGVPTEEFCSLIQSSEPIPDEVSKLTGISDEMLASVGRPIEDVIHDLVEFISNERVVCHNTQFDVGFLQAAARKCGMVIMRDNKFEDTLVLARRRLRGIKSFKLIDIARYFALDTSGAHRAIKDCYLTHLIYEKLNQKHEP